MPEVYRYTDYRKFVKDQLVYSKSINQALTYRFIAGQLGFRSPGFLTQVVQGKSKLPERFVIKLADVMGLKRREARYFELMVHYNQAKTHSDKKSFFEKMIVFKKGQVKTLDPSTYAFYDKWYYSAIRAVLHYYKISDDYKTLAKLLVPSITPAEAKKAIVFLEENGFIRKQESGIYKLTEKHITSGLEADSMVINNFVINTLDIAKDSLHRFPKDERSLSSLTLSVSESGYKKIKERMDRFRKEIVHIVREDEGVDRVYQANFQLFPLTNPLEELTEDGADEE